VDQRQEAFRSQYLRKERLHLDASSRAEWLSEYHWRLTTPVDIQDIQAARERIRAFIFESPLVYTETLSGLTGNSVYLKLENLQMTGSFKERGALNRLLTLTDKERARGVIAASAGNHAQALAFHAGRRGLACEIWMPLNTPLIKVSATRSHGAEVVLHGNNYDEAFEGALRRSAEANLTFIHAFDDAEVIAGQGTLGLEMLAQKPDLDALLVPVGGGGLIGGIGCAVKDRRSDIEIIGVQTEALPSMREAIIAGAPVTLSHSATVADGIAVRRAGSQTFELVKKYVDRIVTVDEEEIAQAILILLEREKTVAEGAGAAALAALMTRKAGLEGRKVAVLVSGGNVDVNLLARIIERGLVRDGRRIRLRIRLQDRPGSLERLASIVAKHKANIIETFHNRQHFGASLGETAIDISLETRGRDHSQEVLRALTDAQYEYQLIS
jgi:threonine dehydratase